MQVEVIWLLHVFSTFIIQKRFLELEKQGVLVKRYANWGNKVRNPIKVGQGHKGTDLGFI